MFGTIVRDSILSMELSEDCLTIKSQSDSDFDYGTIQQNVLDVEPTLPVWNYMQLSELTKLQVRFTKGRE